MEIPESLAHKIALFKETGRVFLDDGDIFRVDSWTQVMLGQGIMPTQYHRIAEIMNNKELESFMASLKQSINKAVEALNEKMSGSDFSGTAKFAIEDEGAIVIDDTGARISDEDADVTLSASADVFQGIMDGSQNPTTAFMTGKLSVDGDMGKAMSLASVLS